MTTLVDPSAIVFRKSNVVTREKVMTVINERLSAPNTFVSFPIKLSTASVMVAVCGSAADTCSAITKYIAEIDKVLIEITKGSPWSYKMDDSYYVFSKRDA